MAASGEQPSFRAGSTAEPPVAVVLAAGASSRMGQPKALLDFDGLTCLELVLSSCAAAGLRRVVVVTAPAAEAVRAAAAHPGLDVTVVVNPAPERGMLSSLQEGLRALPDDAGAFLIFPVDFPLVPAVAIRRLCAAFALRGTGQRIFVPSFATFPASSYAYTEVRSISLEKVRVGVLSESFLQENKQMPAIKRKRQVQFFIEKG